MLFKNHFININILNICS